MGSSLLAPNGDLHAAGVVADTAAAYRCVAHLPDGARGFTTIEPKSNGPGTALIVVGSLVAAQQRLSSGSVRFSTVQ